MLTIIENSRELNKKETYKMTMAPAIQKLSLAKGTIIAVDAYCKYIDKKEDGTEVEILSVLDKDGTCYATNSPTFKKDFANIAAIMDGEDFEIEVISGTSKSGREFITCTLV